ncbi:hypothetical protein THRCLA_08841 [Thraustotheca clavata]|uniref:PPM-type phosphatase domain-containing protein n=1 Tax=Thraustotheca clavata TaxID=74557 RepID=A0A1V9Z1M2_9STRA|nr:hypothetical protein THRCLA_08841 [Thraustotheca clavata]
MAFKYTELPRDDFRRGNLESYTFISEDQRSLQRRENGHVRRHRRHDARRQPYERNSRFRGPNRSPLTRRRRRRDTDRSTTESDDAEDEGEPDDDDEVEEKTQEIHEDGETLEEMEQRLRPRAADLSVSNLLLYGSESWQGAKNTNEDRVTHALDMLPGPVFAIFDGHGGALSADYLVRNLLKNVSASMRQRGLPEPQIKDLLSGKHTDRLKELKKKTEVLEYQQGQLEEMLESNKEMDMREISLMPSVYQDVLQTLADGRSALDLEEKAQSERITKVERVYTQCLEKELFQKALIEGFLFSDAELLRKQYDDGSTGLVAWFVGVRPECLRVILANTGDCRAVLCRNGKATPLTHDHKPSRSDEAARIKRAGGYIGNVNGVMRVCSAAGAGVSLDSNAKNTYLSVSRSFGDRSLKVPSSIVCADPDVKVVNLELNDTFLVLACDGIWDVLSNQEVVDIGLEHFGNPKKAADAIVKKAYSAQSKDNLSATVIQFSWQTEVATSQWTKRQAEKTAVLSVVKESAVLDEELDMFSM